MHFRFKRLKTLKGLMSCKHTRIPVHSSDPTPWDSFEILIKFRYFTSYFMCGIINFRLSNNESSPPSNFSNISTALITLRVTFTYVLLCRFEVITCKQWPTFTHLSPQNISMQLTMSLKMKVTNAILNQYLSVCACGFYNRSGFKIVYRFCEEFAYGNLSRNAVRFSDRLQRLERI
jgi:hypothetical protein